MEWEDIQHAKPEEAHNGDLLPPIHVQSCYDGDGKAEDQDIKEDIEGGEDDQVRVDIDTRPLVPPVGYRQRPKQMSLLVC